MLRDHSPNLKGNYPELIDDRSAISQLEEKCQTGKMKYCDIDHKRILLADVVFIIENHRCQQIATYRQIFDKNSSLQCSVYLLHRTFWLRGGKR